MTKKTEVATVEANEVAINMNDMSAWDDGTEVSSNDIVIPRLHLMQALSELVAEKELAAVGDTVDSLTEEVLTKTGESLEIVPFKVEKLWYIYESTDKNADLERIEACTKANEKRGYEIKEDGVIKRAQYVLKFYVITEKSELPYIVTFKGMSMRAGKQLFTEMFVKNRMAGKTPAQRSFNLSSEKMKNDKGTFYVWKISPKGDSPKDLYETAGQWFMSLRETVVKEHGEEEPVASATPQENY